MASPGGGISLQKNDVLGTYASWTVLFIVHNYSCQWNPFTMFFSLACLVNCSKLVKLTHLETTEKKIEVWWKTKKNPKKYYWILNSKEPTPFFWKIICSHSRSFLPHSIFFNGKINWPPTLAPPKLPVEEPRVSQPRVQGAFTRINSKMQFEKVGEFMIASARFHHIPL